MARRGAPRFRRGRRKREPKLRLLVVCEGKVTEPCYLGGVKRRFRNPSVDIEIVGEGAVPKTVVEVAVERFRQAAKEARRMGDRFGAYDEVWCVFDYDEHPNLDDAFQQAHDHGFEVALSNPSFELWLALHFEDRHAHTERDEARRLCQRHMAGYEKRPPSQLVDTLYDDAVRRAASLVKWQEEQGRPRGNPVTYVHMLTERIRALGNEG